MGEEEPFYPDLVSSESSDEDEEDEEPYDEQGDESDDGGDANIPISAVDSNLNSLIAINQAYLDLIERLTVKVRNLLEKNRDSQKKAKAALGRQADVAECRQVLWRATFAPPYFKDTSDMMPAQNVVSKHIQSICPLNLLMRKEKAWSCDEIEKLHANVVGQLRDAKTRDLMQRQEFLRDKINNFEIADGKSMHAQWQNELSAVDRRLEYLKNLDTNMILEHATYEDIDWTKMALQFNCLRTPLQLRMKWLNEQAPGWNKSDWIENEDAELKKYGQSAWPNWDLVATRLTTQRTPYMCFERFLLIQRGFMSKRPWATEEDEDLLTLVQANTTDGTINWRRVAAGMPERNRSQCETRYVRTLNPTLIHGRWTESEDILLLKAIDKYGPSDWVRISKEVGRRTAAQCRARWIDVLDYKRKCVAWTADDDEALLVGISVFGRSDYSAISKLLPGRNTSDVKARIRTLTRWKIKMMRYKKQFARPNGDRPSCHASVARRIEVFERFSVVRQHADTRSRMAQNLSQRLGYGNHVVASDGQSADYTTNKQECTEKFGQWYISSTGRWCRRARNPNECNAEDLTALKATLDAPTLAELDAFLKERSNHEQQRVQIASVAGDELADSMWNAGAHEARVNKLITEKFVVSNADMVAYQKSLLRKRKTRKDKPVRRASGSSGPKKRRFGLRNTIAPDFTRCIGNTAPRRYTLSDRLTDEICHRMQQIDESDRRKYVFKVMCETIAFQMLADTRNLCATYPQAIMCLKQTAYLNKFLSAEACTDFSAVLINDIEASRSTPESQQVEPRSTLANLLPPSSVTCNMLLLYRDSARQALIVSASQLLDEVRPTTAAHRNGESINIPLSTEVRSHPAYKLLKERMTRLFLLPMLMQRSLEAKNLVAARQEHRAAQQSATAMQTAYLKKHRAKIDARGAAEEQPSTSRHDVNASAANDEVAARLNRLGHYKIYNPLVQTRAETPEREQPERPQRIQQAPRKRRDPSSVAEAVYAELHKRVYKPDVVPPPPSATTTTTVVPSSLSVRDYLRMCRR